MTIRTPTIPSLILRSRPAAVAVGVEEAVVAEAVNLPVVILPVEAILAAADREAVAAVVVAVVAVVVAVVVAGHPDRPDRNARHPP